MRRWGAKRCALPAPSFAQTRGANKRGVPVITDPTLMAALAELGLYSAPAKPTRYRHKVYRSRLEARWAALFDIVGWPHEYEPAFEPGWWLPDFRLCGRVLVEVKPSAGFNPRRKMEPSVWPLLLLNAPPEEDEPPSIEVASASVGEGRLANDKYWQPVHIGRLGQGYDLITGGGCLLSDTEPTSAPRLI